MQAKKFGILGNATKPSAKETVNKLLRLLHAHGAAECMLSSELADLTENGLKYQAILFFCLLNLSSKCIVDKKRNLVKNKKMFNFALLLKTISLLAKIISLFVFLFCFFRP